MPKHSVYLIRLSLGYLATGFTIGALLLVEKAVPLEPVLWLLRPLHVEFLLFGYMVQFAFGVALWILPSPPAPLSAAPVVWAAVLLNSGVWLVGLTAAFPAGYSTGFLNPSSALSTGPAMLAGRLFEAAAMVIFAFQVWPRIRTFRRVQGG